MLTLVEITFQELLNFWKFRSCSSLNFVSKPFFKIVIVLALYIRPTGHVCPYCLLFQFVASKLTGLHSSSSGR